MVNYDGLTRMAVVNEGVHEVSAPPGEDFGVSEEIELLLGTLGEVSKLLLEL